MRCRFCHNPDTWAFGQGQEVAVDELLDKAERYRSYWGNKGGITVSGGEPLMQIDFLIELFEEARRRGINTCIDTSAQPFNRSAAWFPKFEKLMSLTDTVLLDIKHISPDEHKSLTGHDNANILDCASYLSELGKPVWIRHVLVPGITDNDEYLNQLAVFIRELKNVERVDVLPYHSLGTFKYEKLGLEYSLKDTVAPTKERVENAEAILKGLK